MNKVFDYQIIENQAYDCSIKDANGKDDAEYDVYFDAGHFEMTRIYETLLRKLIFDLQRLNVPFLRANDGP